MLRSLLILSLLSAVCFAGDAFDRRREFPNYFLPETYRSTQPTSIPSDVVAKSRAELEATMQSILKRLVVPIVPEGEGKPKMVRYFDYLGGELQKIDPSVNVLPSGGVVRSLIGYIYSEVAKGMNAHPPISPEVTLRNLRNGLSDIPGHLVRGVGSDFDVLLVHEGDKFESLRTRAETITNSAEAEYQFRSMHGGLKRSLFTVGDVKEYEKQTARSVNQGGATIDFLAFDMNTGKFLEPIEHPNTVDNLIRGILEYSPPKAGKNVENPPKQAVRGIRPLIELPFLQYGDETQLRKELEDLEKKVNDRSLGASEVNKMLDQYDKAVRNARFSGAHNRIHRGQSGSIEELILRISKAIESKYQRSTIPEFVDSFSIRAQGTRPAEGIPHNLLMDPNTFIANHTDKGKLYHGTREMEQALAIMRGGLFVSKGDGRILGEKTTIAVYGRGGYSSKDKETAFSYAGANGLVFELEVSHPEHLNILDWSVAQYEPAIKKIVADAERRGIDPFEVLARAHGIDIIIHNHVLVQNLEAISYPRDFASLVRSFGTIMENHHATAQARVEAYDRYRLLHNYGTALGETKISPAPNPQELWKRISGDSIANPMDAYKALAYSGLLQTTVFENNQEAAKFLGSWKTHRGTTGNSFEAFRDLSNYGFLFNQAMRDSEERNSLLQAWKAHRSTFSKPIDSFEYLFQSPTPLKEQILSDADEATLLRNSLLEGIKDTDPSKRKEARRMIFDNVPFETPANHELHRRAVLSAVTDRDLHHETARYLNFLKAEDTIAKALFSEDSNYTKLRSLILRRFNDPFDTADVVRLLKVALSRGELFFQKYPNLRGVVQQTVERLSQGTDLETISEFEKIVRDHFPELVPHYLREIFKHYSGAASNWDPNDPQVDTILKDGMRDVLQAKPSNDTWAILYSERENLKKVLGSHPKMLAHLLGFAPGEQASLGSAAWLVEPATPAAWRSYFLHADAATQLSLLKRPYRSAAAPISLFASEITSDQVWRGKLRDSLLDREATLESWVHFPWDASNEMDRTFYISFLKGENLPTADRRTRLNLEQIQKELITGRLLDHPDIARYIAKFRNQEFPETFKLHGLGPDLPDADRIRTKELMDHPIIDHHSLSPYTNADYRGSPAASDAIANRLAELRPTDRVLELFPAHSNGLLVSRVIGKIQADPAKLRLFRQRVKEEVSNGGDLSGISSLPWRLDDPGDVELLNWLRRYETPPKWVGDFAKRHKDAMGSQDAIYLSKVEGYEEKLRAAAYNRAIERQRAIRSIFRRISESSARQFVQHFSNHPLLSTEAGKLYDGKWSLGSEIASKVVNRANLGQALDAETEAVLNYYLREKNPHVLHALLQGKNGERARSILLQLNDQEFTNFVRSGFIPRTMLQTDAELRIKVRSALQNQLASGSDWTLHEYPWDLKQPADRESLKVRLRDFIRLHRKTLQGAAEYDWHSPLFPFLRELQEKFPEEYKMDIEPILNTAKVPVFLGIENHQATSKRFSYGKKWSDLSSQEQLHIRQLIESPLQRNLLHIIYRLMHEAEADLSSPRVALIMNRLAKLRSGDSAEYASYVLNNFERAFPRQYSELMQDGSVKQSLRQLMKVEPTSAFPWNYSDPTDIQLIRELDEKFSSSDSRIKPDSRKTTNDILVKFAVENLVAFERAFPGRSLPFPKLSPQWPAWDAHDKTVRAVDIENEKLSELMEPLRTQHVEDSRLKVLQSRYLQEGNHKFIIWLLLEPKSEKLATDAMVHMSDQRFAELWSLAEHEPFVRTLSEKILQAARFENPQLRQKLIRFLQRNDIAPRVLEHFVKYSDIAQDFAPTESNIDRSLARTQLRQMVESLPRGVAQGHELHLIPPQQVPQNKRAEYIRLARRYIVSSSETIRSTWHEDRCLKALSALAEEAHWPPPISGTDQ